MVMDYDETVVRGGAGRPAVFFVHGLGMDKNMWVAPSESRIMGGSLPLSFVLASEPRSRPVKDTKEEDDVPKGLSIGDPPRRLATLFHSLRDFGYTVITWSQRRPVAEIKVAVSELRAMITKYAKFCEAGIILIGHSRGGLVAREYLRGGDKRVRALITLATPHKGSSMASWVKYMTPLTSAISPLLSEAERGTLKHSVRRIFDFLESAAVREILPGSHFFEALDDGRLEGIYYLSAGGDNPTLFSVYRRAVEKVKYGDGVKSVLRARRVFSVPDIFERIIPKRFYPDEMKRGKGDGLVSVESSRIPWTDNHFVFEVNHAKILFDERVKSIVVKAIKDLE